MNHSSLAEVRARLDQTVSTKLPDQSSPEEQFRLYEQIANDILENESAYFIDGELQEYLMTLLYARQLELELVAFPDPLEE